MHLKPTMRFGFIEVAVFDRFFRINFNHSNQLFDSYIFILRIFKLFYLFWFLFFCWNVHCLWFYEYSKFGNQFKLSLCHWFSNKNSLQSQYSIPFLRCNTLQQSTALFIFKLRFDLFYLVFIFIEIIANFTVKSKLNLHSMHETN